MTLVIMAAGMGSRFGGLKQVTPVGPNGEFIIDYSIYDAIKAGFNKVVFIIKEENYELFRTTIGHRIENKIDVDYVFQSNDDVKEDVEIPSERVKPLGTGHAILCCKDVVNEPFVIINADDFYGADAFLTASKFIKENVDEHNYAVVGYNIANTISANGAVKRGVCTVQDHKLIRLIESSVERLGNQIVATPISGAPSFVVDKNATVSMNMFVFYPNLFDYLKNDFDEFLKTANLLKDEFYIPNVVFKHIYTRDITCDVLATTAVWKGITYASDLDAFKAYIKDEIERGVYPVDLYK